MSPLNRRTPKWTRKKHTLLLQRPTLLLKYLIMLTISDCLLNPLTHRTCLTSAMRTSFWASIRLCPSKNSNLWFMIDLSTSWNCSVLILTGNLSPLLMREKWTIPKALLRIIKKAKLSKNHRSFQNLSNGQSSISITTMNAKRCVNSLRNIIM